MYIFFVENVLITNRTVRLLTKATQVVSINEPIQTYKGIMPRLSGSIYWLFKSTKYLQGESHGDRRLQRCSS